MPGKAVISLTTGLEDPEKVMVAFLVALGAAEQGRPTLTFLTKEAVRLALTGVAAGSACGTCRCLQRAVPAFGGCCERSDQVPAPLALSADAA